MPTAISSHLRALCAVTEGASAKKPWILQDAIWRTQTLQSNFSDICLPGYYHNNGTKSCQPCEKKSYQNKTWSYSCKWCPNGRITQNKGAKTLSECISKSDFILTISRLIIDKSQVAKVRAHPGSSSFSLVLKCSRRF
jgi:hypothetical protein